MYLYLSLSTSRSIIGSLSYTHPWELYMRILKDMWKILHDYVSFKTSNISYRIMKRVVCNCMSKYWGKKARRNKKETYLIWWILRFSAHKQIQVHIHEHKIYLTSSVTEHYNQNDEKQNIEALMHYYSSHTQINIRLLV